MTRKGPLLPGRQGCGVRSAGSKGIRSACRAYTPLVRTALELLAQHEPRLKAIRRLAGVPSAHWDRLYLGLFLAFVAFVQERPTSEAHHHAGLGGMLAHGLETVFHGLRLRRGHLLPHGAVAEEIAAQQDLWSYATATAALLHDVGKPVTDQRIALHDRCGTSLGRWEPWLRPMPSAARWYRIEFVRGRRYQVHEKVVALPMDHVRFPHKAHTQWLTCSNCHPQIFIPKLGATPGASHLDTYRFQWHF